MSLILTDPTDSPQDDSGQISLSTFLSRYANRNSPLGDLARDAAYAADFPDRPEGVRLYLERHGACDGALRAGGSLVAAYRRHVRRSAQVAA